MKLQSPAAAAAFAVFITATSSGSVSALIIRGQATFVAIETADIDVDGDENNDFFEEDKDDGGNDTEIVSNNECGHPNYPSLGYNMSIVPKCKGEQLSYDTGGDTLNGIFPVDIRPLIEAAEGKTFNYFEYSGATNPEDGKCYADSSLPWVMNFDNDGAPDCTVAECTYRACYEESCIPYCCCQNIILIEVTD